ncbi:Cdc25 phosphatase Ibp1 [Exophiala xenobiotica]|uniref:Cdc25 phosphatase Ibp1 n=1 Tax=Lithohypha guttulata TaxID=1690604 RepID=A0ABR0KGG2_9EURO|nr:Cdc25 phosphatase Ibp1 [Lithohypha guttulata]KAK5323552.1 Cdc25 phosphatase Ibp1 [Exophiala xenobiotica]
MIKRDGHLKFVKPADLANSLRQEQTASRITVIDVRDNDHVGGHIKGSQWVPLNQLDARMPELLRANKDMERVVFHCMLSQQRGPKAALAYVRAKAYDTEKRQKELGEEGKQEEETNSDDQKVESGGQEVCVLEGGFGGWQALYGEDKMLTDGYVRDIWD